MENQQCCRAAFLDVSQAFDQVWHTGLLFKIKRILPSSYFIRLKSYLNERQFGAKINTETSSRFHIHSGVPQGSILGPLLYVLHTSDLPASSETILGTFADDTAIFSIHEDPTIAALNLQEHLHIIEKWLKKWKIKINESKSSHITFTLRKGHCPAVNIKQTIIPQTETVKYRRTTLRLQVKLERTHRQKKKTTRLKNKREQLVDRKKCHLSIDNKLLIYKAVNKPTWSYGIELWGCASKSNKVIMQSSQSKILRDIANPPWYVTNHALH